MAYRGFEGKKHASVYQKYRIDPPEEIQKLILGYLDKKKEKPHDLAVDVGCGTGQLTRQIACHFKLVVGTDISEAQIHEARMVPGFPNVSYKVCPAETLPFDNSSVDLITAATAAHYFDTDTFLKEVERILKPQGCIALLSYTSKFEFFFPGAHHGRLSEIYEEECRPFFPYISVQGCKNDTMLQEMFEAITYPDKERIEDIIYKIRKPLSDIVGLTESFSPYQNFVKAEPDVAKTVLQRIEQRFLEEMKVSSPETELEMWLHYYCILASKPK
ncbi:putative methyltransferase DDB_G0268948 [Polypterus senegalus]|uniref:putative methyltransferase DDB_G0268948 n=1 Tax=Polypterus senegalus TaxID=55291 RepID=UPI0019654A56|nr:putative methyltransferase DDB_G0268948 [Polypterus senegalus]